MGIVKKQDFAALVVGEELVCADCLQEDEDYEKGFTSEEIDNDSENDYFCDRCEKKIS